MLSESITLHKTVICKHKEITSSVFFVSSSSIMAAASSTGAESANMVSACSPADSDVGGSSSVDVGIRSLCVCVRGRWVPSNTVTTVLWTGRGQVKWSEIFQVTRSLNTKLKTQTQNTMVALQYGLYHLSLVCKNTKKGQDSL